MKVNLWLSLVTPVPCGQGVGDPEASSRPGIRFESEGWHTAGSRRTARAQSSVRNLGDPSSMRRESEEVIVVMKRVMIVERRAST